MVWRHGSALGASQEGPGTWFARAAAIGAATLNPALGLKGGPLRPELTIDALGVSAIFLLSGLGLPLNELTSAAMNVKLNAFIQLLNLGAYPVLVKLGCMVLSRWRAAAAEQQRVAAPRPATASLNSH